MTPNPPYTLDELRRQMSGPITCSPIDLNYGEWATSGLRFSRTGARGTREQFATMYRHPCGKIVLATDRDAAVTLETLLLLLPVMDPDTFDQALIRFDAIMRGWARE